MTKEYQEYMQMLADNSARIKTGGVIKAGTVREARSFEGVQIGHYSYANECLARDTQSMADPGELSKMPQAVDNGRHQRAADSAALQSWEIEKQIEREQLLGNQAK
jgi:hypothetical protein